MTASRTNRAASPALFRATCAAVGLWLGLAAGSASSSTVICTNCAGADNCKDICGSCGTNQSCSCNIAGACKVTSRPVPDDPTLPIDPDPRNPGH